MSNKTLKPGMIVMSPSTDITYLFVRIMDDPFAFTAELRMLHQSGIRAVNAIVYIHTPDIYKWHVLAPPLPDRLE